MRIDTRITARVLDIEHKVHMTRRCRYCVVYYDYILSKVKHRVLRRDELTTNLNSETFISGTVIHSIQTYKLIQFTTYNIREKITKRLNIKRKLNK